MPVLFCNVAWMRDYAGRDDKDPPLGGGAFPRRHGYCGEECNFVKGDDGFVYGHFETIKGKSDREVRIERLGASRSAAFVDGVDVIWTAPDHGDGARVVVGWSRNARVYRARQQFVGDYPSARHRKDEITSFRVKARARDVTVVPPDERTLKLGHGPGWSGQASWWYADDTTVRAARRFVGKVKAAMRSTTAQGGIGGGGTSGKKGRAGAAASDPYVRYVKEYEAKVHPRHDRLQRRLVAFLRARHRAIDFPECFRDDLRYVVPGTSEVMVEVKPTEPTTVRFAIRTAAGQLLDYRQRLQWSGRQLIIVETAVTNADDLSLAHDNGFGVGWPNGPKSFELRWPPGAGRRGIAKQAG